MVKDSAKKRITTLACVTDRVCCKRIIRTAERIADILNSSLDIISISDPDPSKQDPDSIEYLFGIAKKHDAKMNVYYSDNPYRVLSSFIKKNRVAAVVTGFSQENNKVLSRLRARFIAIDFFAVNLDDTAVHITKNPPSPDNETVA